MRNLQIPQSKSARHEALRLLHAQPAFGSLDRFGRRLLERVRSLVQAEFPAGISVLRNYDPSVPDLVGDIEQLIQAVLNVVRNAAQALLSGQNGGRGGTIVLRTRAARQVTIARQRHKLALELQVIDDGPGVPVRKLSRKLRNLFGRELS
jgi:nitrogen-specific signal transduction histidine kinase